MVMMMQQEIQKITAHIPKHLLESAIKSTGRGITDTLKIGLEMIERAYAYEELYKMRGKVAFSIDVDELRKDRGEL